MTEFDKLLELMRREGLVLQLSPSEMHNGTLFMLSTCSDSATAYAVSDVIGNHEHFPLAERVCRCLRESWEVGMEKQHALQNQTSG